MKLRVYECLTLYDNMNRNSLFMATVLEKSI